MKLTIETFTVHKKFPLQISRGTTAQTTNIWLRIQEDGVEGWGEASPFSLEAGIKKDTEQLVEELHQIAPTLEAYHPLERQKIEEILQQVQLSSSVRAAIDMALHDWLGKKVGLPLWRLWGLDPSRIVPISVPVGINTPARARQRVRDCKNMMEVKNIKVK